MTWTFIELLLSRTSVFVEQPLRFVQPVQGRLLVGVRERGVIEDNVLEVINGASVVHDRLSYVYQFRGLLPHYVDPEEPPVVPVEEELQHAVDIPDYLPPRDLLEV